MHGVQSVVWRENQVVKVVVCWSFSELFYTPPVLGTSLLFFIRKVAIGDHITRLEMIDLRIGRHGRHLEDVKLHQHTGDDSYGM